MESFIEGFLGETKQILWNKTLVSVRLTWINGWTENGEITLDVYGFKEYE